MELTFHLRRGGEVEDRRLLGRDVVLLLCDIWDTHWCNEAALRLGPLAERVNAVAVEARKTGVHVVHAPSDTMAFYAGYEQRTRARDPAHAATGGMDTLGVSRLGKRLRSRLNRLRNVDDGPAPPLSPGCRCRPPCRRVTRPPWPWTRQHEAIRIEHGDWISEDGPEILRLCRGLDAKLVLIAGVHTNVCVLDRPFGIRALRRWGLPVALLRDLTEAWTPDLTDEVVSYIEEWHCPTVTSSDLVGAV